MPVINAIIVAVLPDDGEGVGADGFEVVEARGRRISKLLLEYLRVWLGVHVLMSAAAGGTRTARAQQTKWIDTGVSIIPVDGELAGLFIGGDVGGFFVHDSFEGRYGNGRTIHRIRFAKGRPYG